jgi:hypothetical protein
MDLLDNLEERVETFLGQLGLETARVPHGVTVLRSRRATVLITTFPQDGTTWCRLAAIVLTDLEPTLSLLHRLLQLNNDVLMGGFRLFEDRTLVFSTTLQGDTLDHDSFARALRYVAHVADRFGPELRCLARGVEGAQLFGSATGCGSSP